MVNAMISTDVLLPRDHEARFPDKCVVCGYDSPPSTMKVVAEVSGQRRWLPRARRKQFATAAPACNLCGWQRHIHRLRGLGVTIGLFAIVFCCRQWLKDLPGFMIEPIVCACCIPTVLYQIFFPPSLDVTVLGESVAYEFRDDAIARDFAELNSDAEWVQVG
jgi:hypothetical protein